MTMTLLRTLALSGALAAVLGVAACQTAPPTATTGYIAAAVADPARPQADKDRDADRKPGEMIAFADTHPGETIGELIPGGGYMTRLFSKAVGPKGHVYLFNGPPRQGQAAQAFQPVLDDTANYGNVSFIQTDFKTLAAPEKLDLVWTSQNYHDIHNPGRNIDINVANKAVYDALKPGGLYVVLDHQSAKGQDFDANLHRIDMQRVKTEVLAVGFEFAGESKVLNNPADDGTKSVFDPSIRGKTNQFILKFRKPG
jgi:predicted methyltransferase